MVDLCVRAERANVNSAWVVMPATALDTLTLLGAAAMKTERITLGTSIVPAFTRHPLAFVTQALALEGSLPAASTSASAAPTRGRWSTSTTSISTGPCAADRIPPHRAAGAEDRFRAFRGRVLSSGRQLPACPGTPVPIAALRAPAFRVAGRLADGAMSWNCPTAYIQQVAMPALQEGADSAGRDRPRLMVHVPVMVTTDRDEVHRKAGEQLRYYAAAPFYARMFADAGYPLLPDGGVSPVSPS